MRRLAKTAGIAHTIVKDSPILIWDEDTSAVDNEIGRPFVTPSDWSGYSKISGYDYPKLYNHSDRSSPI
ncbi:MAG: hypothetical protein V7K41_17605 [Nostoc sp.]|uniref:hypothetical protein n=1 Tax=Nostoc sp. TaxID=1180 RepID=UPI002FF5C27C